MNQLEIDRLAAMGNALRPDWPVASLRTLLAQPDLARRSRHDVAIALAWVACDSTTTTPARINEAGPWWRAGTEQATSRGPTPEQECRTHPGQYAATCSGCTSDRLAHEEDSETRRKAAARRATHCEHDVPRAECPPCKDHDPEAERRADKDAPGTVTAKQIRRLHVGFHEAGLNSRTEYLAYCQARVNRYVDTTKDLSLNEAKRVIDGLDAIVALENQPHPDQEEAGTA